MHKSPECLRDCKAACCFRINIALSDEEAKMFPIGSLVDWRTRTSEGLGGYFIDGPCPFLRGNRCQLHGKPNQPLACQNTMTGSNYCLGKRMDRPERVVNFTVLDEEFESRNKY